MMIEAYNGTFLIERSEMVHISRSEPVTEEYLYSDGKVIPLYEFSITLVTGMVTYVVDTFENIVKIRGELL